MRRSRPRDPRVNCQNGRLSAFASLPTEFATVCKLILFPKNNALRRLRQKKNWVCGMVQKAHLSGYKLAGKPHGQISRGSMSNIATMPSNIATLAMLLLRSKLLSEHVLGRSEGVTLSHCHLIARRWRTLAVFTAAHRDVTCV